MSMIRARKVIAGKPVGQYQIFEKRELAGVGERIVRAIDRADAQGRGCSGCKAIRKKARAMIMKIARRHV